MKRKCKEGIFDDKKGETSTKKLKETQESAEYWAEQYMFLSGSNSKTVSLICGFCVSVVKKYNMRHFTATHPDCNKKYPKDSELRQVFIEKSVRSLCSQQSLFVKILY